MVRRNLTDYGWCDATKREALACATGRRLALRHLSAIWDRVVARTIGMVARGDFRGHGTRFGHRHAYCRCERQSERQHVCKECAGPGHSVRFPCLLGASSFVSRYSSIHLARLAPEDNHGNSRCDDPLGHDCFLFDPADTRHGRNLAMGRANRKCGVAMGSIHVGYSPLLPNIGL